jgi:two-component system, NarL family, response regulator
VVLRRFDQRRYKRRALIAPCADRESHQLSNVSWKSRSGADARRAATHSADAVVGPVHARAHRPPSHGPVIRVLCFEEHALLRDGIAALLGDHPDLQVVGQAATPADLIGSWATLKPDVVLIDPWFDGANHIEVIATLASQDTGIRIVVLAVHQNDADVLQAIAAGAMAYVSKDTHAAELVRTIRQVHAGGRLLPAAIEAQLAALPALRRLTAREVEVLELVARGLRNREIGTSLGISAETVQVHVRNILAKLDVPDRTAATSVAFRRGLIRL